MYCNRLLLTSLQEKNVLSIVNDLIAFRDSRFKENNEYEIGTILLFEIARVFS